jgi:hypothetical protein
MPRNLTTEMVTALTATILYPAVFVNLTFSTGPVYVWSGAGSVSWNSSTWLGLGSLLGLSTPEDSSNVEAKGISVTISGLDSSYMAGALREIQLGLPAIIYLGFYTSLGGTLINTPAICWSGRMDQPTFSISGSEATITFNCENRLLDMNIDVSRHYTNEDQQMSYPGDLCFMFVDGLQEKNLLWGQTTTSTNNI